MIGSMSKQDTVALLDAAAKNYSVIQYGEVRYRMAKNPSGFYSAQRIGTGITLSCHVAIDGTIRLSDSERFGEFLPGA
jgi:hypothetical protein